MNYFETEFGRVYKSDTLQTTMVDEGYILSLEDDGVTLSFLSYRVEPRQVTAGTKPDLEIVCRIWMPRRTFEAMAAAWQNQISDWREEGNEESRPTP